MLLHFDKQHRRIQNLSNIQDEAFSESNQQLKEVNYFRK